jgi:hypothetical protein
MKDSVNHRLLSNRVISEFQKESKELRAEKSTKVMARRNILRLGALGAVAVLAANVIPGADVRAATEQAGTAQSPSRARRRRCTPRRPASRPARLRP